MLVNWSIWGLWIRPPGTNLLEDHGVVQVGLPVADRHRSVLADVASRQIEQLQQRVVARECAAVLGQLAQAHAFGPGVHRPSRGKPADLARPHLTDGVDQVSRPLLLPSLQSLAAAHAR